MNSSLACGLLPHQMESIDSPTSLSMISVCQVNLLSFIPPFIFESFYFMVLIDGPRFSSPSISQWALPA